jgi:hypothetical protein
MSYDPNKQGSGEVVLSGKGRSRSAKLSCEQVRAIRADRAKGLTYKELANIYPVGTHSIWRICTGSVYKWCND